MVWNSFLETTSTIANTVTAIAAALAAIAAVKGISAWRAQRRAEIAVSALAEFYQVIQIYYEIREPFVRPWEMHPKDGEDPELASNSDMTPARRLRVHQEFMARFRVREFEMVAWFGAPAQRPYEIVREVNNRITAETERLLDYALQGDQVDQKLFEQAREVIFRPKRPKRDVIKERLDEAVTLMEAICAPQIEKKIWNII